MRRLTGSPRTSNACKCLAPCEAASNQRLFSHVEPAGALGRFPRPSGVFAVANGRFAPCVTAGAHVVLAALGSNPRCTFFRRVPHPFLDVHAETEQAEIPADPGSARAELLPELRRHLGGVLEGE